MNARTPYPPDNVDTPMLYAETFFEIYLQQQYNSSTTSARQCFFHKPITCGETFSRLKTSICRVRKRLIGVCTSPWIYMCSMLIRIYTLAPRVCVCMEMQIHGNGLAFRPLVHSRLRSPYTARRARTHVRNPQPLRVR